MATQTLEIGDEKHEIEVRPVNLIVQGAESAVLPPIKYPGCVVLDPEATVYHAQRVQKLDPQFRKVWDFFQAGVEHKSSVEPTPDNIRKGNLGGVHLMGLIDMTLKLMKLGKNVVWKYPETYLHPGWAVGLGDLAIYFGKGMFTEEDAKVVEAFQFQLYATPKAGGEAEATGVMLRSGHVKEWLGLNDMILMNMTEYKVTGQEPLVVNGQTIPLNHQGFDYTIRRMPLEFESW